MFDERDANSFSIKLKVSKFKWQEGLFLLTVGTLLVWSLSITIISGTELNFFPAAALWRAFAVMAALWIIFYNKYTLIFSGIVAVVAIAILAVDALFLVPSDVYEAANHTTIVQNIFQPISGAIRYATGFISYTPEYDMVIVWTLAIVLGIFVMAFGLLWFNFYALLAVSAVTMGIMFSSGLFIYDFGFYVYVFCIIAYLIRHLNMKTLGKNNKKTPFSLYAVPITAIVLIPAIVIPSPEAGHAARMRETLITRPFNAVNDQIAAFLQPRHFSLAQTGFGGGGGRQLGGNVATNNRVFMRISPDRREIGGLIYLTGATFDVYTGYSWLNSFGDDVEAVDMTQISQNLEALERMSAPFTLWAADDFFDVYQDILQNFEVLLRMQWEAEHAFRVQAAYNIFTSWNVDTAFEYAFRELLAETFDLETMLGGINPLQLGLALEMVDYAFSSRWGTPHRLAGRYRIGDISQIVFANLHYRYTAVEHAFRSYNVFSRGIFAGVEGDGNLDPVREAGGAIMSSTMMRGGAGYTVRHSALAGEVDKTALMAASRRGVFEDALRNTVYSNFPRHMLNFNVGGNVILYTHLLYYLAQHANWIYEAYTGLPAIPARVRDLAQRITYHAENDFQRATMIADYLRWHGGYTYTLTPGDTPQGRDFVDWFLFDAREGYCVHFATAFVVMVRSLGIPARYVEGFMVPNQPDADGYIDVVNRMGHAWGEVYFEGFGWQLFEATPPEAVFGWQTPQTQTTPGFWDYLELDGADWGFFEDYWFIPEGDGGTSIIIDSSAYEEGYDEPPNQAAPMSIRELLLTATMGAGGLVALFMLLRLILSELRFRRLCKSDGRVAALAYYTRILRYLECLDLRADEGDTPLIFARRLGYRAGFENNKVRLEDITHILYRAKYSPHPIGDKEKEIMRNTLFMLDFKLKETVGFWKYCGYKLMRIPHVRRVD
ncbi:MAG: transglutaminase-like domain-containing protein [Defluviitaleaceae bacterium]|nr:transglutaminase-like domain-containing protein [Defluviitaleaceae bacterium]